MSSSGMLGLRLMLCLTPISTRFGISWAVNLIKLRYEKCACFIYYDQWTLFIVYIL